MEAAGPPSPGPPRPAIRKRADTLPLGHRPRPLPPPGQPGKPRLHPPCLPGFTARAGSPGPGAGSAGGRWVPVAPAHLRHVAARAGGHPRNSRPAFEPTGTLCYFPTPHSKDCTLPNTAGPGNSFYPEENGAQLKAEIFRWKHGQIFPYHKIL